MQRLACFPYTLSLQHTIPSLFSWTIYHTPFYLLWLLWSAKAIYICTAGGRITAEMCTITSIELSTPNSMIPSSKTLKGGYITMAIHPIVIPRPLQGTLITLTFRHLLMMTSRDRPGCRLSPRGGISASWLMIFTRNKLKEASPINVINTRLLVLQHHTAIGSD